MSNRQHQHNTTTSIHSIPDDRETAWDSAFDSISPLDSDSETYYGPTHIAQLARETQLRLQIIAEDAAAIKIQRWIQHWIREQRETELARIEAGQVLADFDYWYDDWQDNY